MKPSPVARAQLFPVDISVKIFEGYVIGISGPMTSVTHFQTRAGSVGFDAPTTITFLAFKCESKVDFFNAFYMFTAPTTSLTSKCEPEVDIYDVFNMFTAATSLASKCEPEVSLFGCFNMFEKNGSRTILYHIYKKF